MEQILRALTLCWVHFHNALLFSAYGTADGIVTLHRINVIKNGNLTLECPLTNFTKDVAWYLEDTERKEFVLCRYQEDTCRDGRDFSSKVAYHPATRNDTFSTVNILNGSSILSASGVKIILCIDDSSDNILQRFRVNVVNPEQFPSPKCNILPSKSEGQLNLLAVELVCEANSSQEIVPQLNIDGVKSDYSTNDTLSRVTSEISFNIFKTMHYTSCQLSIRDIDIHRSCTFPQYINVNLTNVAGKDAEYACDAGATAVGQTYYSWRLLDLSGHEVNIENRSWQRDGGKHFLLQNIYKSDLGSVIVCRLKQDQNSEKIGFAMISSNYVSNNSLSRNNDKVYVILTFCFLVLCAVSLSCSLYTIISKKVSLSCLPCFFHESSGRKENHVSPTVGDDPETLELHLEATTAMPGREQEVGKPQKSSSAFNYSSNTNWNNKNQSTTVASTSVLQTLQQSDPDDHTYFIVDKSLPSSSSSSFSSNLSYLKECPIRVRDSDGYDIVNVPEGKTARSFDMEYDKVGDYAGDQKTMKGVYAPLCEKPARGRKGVARLYGVVKK